MEDISKRCDKIVRPKSASIRLVVSQGYHLSVLMLNEFLLAVSPSRSIPEWICVLKQQLVFFLLSLLYSSRPPRCTTRIGGVGSYEWLLG